MKITIDTTYTPHSITVEDGCTLGELTSFLSKYYPDFAWKDIRIVSKIVYGNQWGTTGSGTYSTLVGTTGPIGAVGVPGPSGHTTTQPWAVGNFPGSSITYCSDTGFTNAAGNNVVLTSLFEAK